MAIFKSSSAALVAGVLLVATGLSGCVDVSMEVAVLGEDSARATTVMSMDRSMYDMSQGQNASDFCEDGTESLTETSAVCTTIVEGNFALMTEGASDDEPQPSIKLISPGLVRVTFPTGTISEDFGPGDAAMDEQGKKMMQSMFEGHTLKLAVTGGKITETNMSISPDGKTAFLDLPLVSLIGGEIDLPDESFAVVKLP